MDKAAPLPGAIALAVHVEPRVTFRPRAAQPRPSVRPKLQGIAHTPAPDGDLAPDTPVEFGNEVREAEMLGRQPFMNEREVLI